MFKHAIVRTPCPEMIHGITSATLGKPDYTKALSQHKEYVKALGSLGLEITILDPDSRYPDSTFVEDVAMCTEGFSVITNPGAVSRNGEQKDMKGVLDFFYDTIEQIKPPGTLDGGDVMMVGLNYYIGISDRTNQEGADQLIHILEKNGMTGEKIEIENMLHLKSGFSYLENNNLLAQNRLLYHPVFERFREISVAVDENYAANSLWVNGTVLVPAGFPETRSNIEKAGYPTLTLEVSEFEKLDGGLSCLSLRF